MNMSADRRRRTASSVGVGVLLLACGALVAGCEREPTAAEQAAKDERDVAQVRAIAEAPPPQPIAPENIGFSDIEANDLFGAGCAFSPPNSMSVLTIAQPDRAYLKLDGKIIALAADKGSESLPLGAWTRYDGEKYQLSLSRAAGEGEASGAETVDYSGEMVVRDPQDRPVFQRSGTIRCGA